MGKKLNELPANDTISGSDLLALWQSAGTPKKLRKVSASDLQAFFLGAHNHDDRYYTQAEVDALFSALPPVAWGSITGALTDQADLTTYISNQIAALVDSSPAALDTLNELAAALGDDANFATTVTTALSNKSDLGHTHALSDLTQSGATTGQVATWSGTAWVPVTPSPGVTDHGLLSGLADDDHAQYHTDARGDARYSLLAHTHASFEVSVFDTLDPLTGDEWTPSDAQDVAERAHTVYKLYNALNSTVSLLEDSVTSLQSDYATLDNEVIQLTDNFGEHYSGLGFLHAISHITGLQTALDGKAGTAHTHTKANITDFTEAVYVHTTGNESIAGIKTFSDITNISNTTAATSAITGALKITGGLGVAGNIFGESNFSGAADAAGFLRIKNTGNTGPGQNNAAFLETTGDSAALVLRANPTTKAVFVATHDVLATGVANGRVFGGGATGENFQRFVFYSNGAFGIGPGTGTRDVFFFRDGPNSLGIANTFAGSPASGKLKIYGTDESTSTTTGAMVVSGGVGIAKTLRVGKQIWTDKSPDQYPVGIVVDESSHATSRRAAISLGAGWQITQDSAGNGTRDFGLYSSALGGNPFSIATNGDWYRLGAKVISAPVAVSDYAGANPVYTGIDNSQSGDVYAQFDDLDNLSGQVGSLESAVQGIISALKQHGLFIDP